MTEQERANKIKRLRLIQIQKERLVLEKSKLDQAPDDVGGFESFARGTAEGLTLGTAPHIAESLGLEEDSVEKFKQAYEANPGLYNTGDYGTSLGVALLTGGGSVPAQLASKVAAKGLVKLGKKELAKRAAAAAAPKTIAGMAKLGAVEGAIEGAARSTSDDLAGRLQDAAFGGTVGVVAPKAFDVAGKGVRGVTRGTKGAGKAVARGLATVPSAVLPSGKGPIADSLRSLSKKAAMRGGVSPETADTYEALLKSPERLKKALGAEATYRADAPGLQDAVKKFRDQSKKAASRQYQKLKKTATKEMFKDYDKILSRGKKVVGDSIGDTKTFRNQYSDNARRVLTQAFEIITGQTRGVQKLMDAGATTDQSVQSAITESLIDARKHLDLNIDYAKRDGLDLDAKLLRDTRKSLDKIYKEVPELEAADKFWRSYKDEARPMLDSFTGRGKTAERIKTHSVDKWIRDAGGAGALERDSLRRGFQSFVEENPGMTGLTKGSLQSFEKKFEKYRDAQDIRSLVSESGARTGKSLGSNPLIGMAAFGPVGAALSAILQPGNNPASYLKNVQMVRDWMAKTDPATVKKALGPMYQRVLDTLRVGTVRGAIKGDLYQQQAQ